MRPAVAVSSSGASDWVSDGASASDSGARDWRLRRGRRGRAGASTRCSATTPCRPRTTTRSPRTRASSTSWVTKTTVQPDAAQRLDQQLLHRRRGSGRRARRTARPCRSRRARRRARGRAGPAAACRRRAGRAAARRTGTARPAPATRRPAGAARARPTPCSCERQLDVARGPCATAAARRPGRPGRGRRPGPSTSPAVGDDLAGERRAAGRRGPAAAWTCRSRRGRATTRISPGATSRSTPSTTGSPA